MRQLLKNIFFSFSINWWIKQPWVIRDVLKKICHVFPSQADFPVFNQFFVLYFLRLLCWPARGALKADKCSLANAHSRGSILLSKTDFHFGNEVFHITLPMASCAQSWQAAACVSWFGGFKLHDLLCNVEKCCFLLQWVSVKCGLFLASLYLGNVFPVIVKTMPFGCKVFALGDTWKERTSEGSGNPVPSEIPSSRTNHAPYLMTKGKS